MENSSAVTVARVSFDHEAVSLVAALEDARIKACSRPVASEGLLAMPGAFGMPEHGIEVLVGEQDAYRAADIAAGMGYGLTDADANGEPVGTAPDSEDDGDDTADREHPDEAAKDEPKSPLASAVLTIFALVSIALFVWLCDFVIQWVISLLR